MAIAHVAKGTTQKVDAGLGTHSIPLPAGHASGHVLFLFSVGDDNANIVTGPSGWTKLMEIFPGLSGGLLFRPRLEVWYRIDNGSLGSSVNVTYSTATWPSGNGSTMVWTEAWSGCDTTGPIEGWNYTTTTADTAAQAHPVFALGSTNCWLVTLRASYSGTARTFTCSVGTDAERVDDNFNGVHAALYDSNAGLSAGTPTQRTTTASGTTAGGSDLVTIALKPPATVTAVFASAEVAEGAGAAYDTGTTEVEGTWGLCTSNAPDYEFAVDWDGSGSYAGEEVTSDILPEVTISYGRDQERQLNPAAVGSAALSLINADRRYSPENTSSPLSGNLNPGRDARFQVVWSGVTYPLFQGRIDDYDVRVDRDDRTASFTFLDGLGKLQSTTLSTAVYQAQRTGDLINTILDLVGWTGGRDVDPGATVVPYWWEEGTDALEAVNKIVRSEGPPSIAYVGPDGTFIFRDRHHRLLRQRSQDVQAVFGAAQMTCDAPAVTGFDFTKPFTYQHGLRDIVNVVNFSVTERSPDSSLTAVWTSESSISLSIGQSQVIDVSGSDPFTDAVVPVSGTDYSLTGSGTASITLNRTSGASVKITILAVGGDIVLSNLQLRARAIPGRRTVKVSQTDSGSVTDHGERTYPDDAPWAGVNDSYAIANMILLHYATRRPTVQMRVVAQDPAHLAQILLRTVSDRIHIRNDEMGLDADFFVEKVVHTITRFNKTGQPPVHSVVLGCEKDLTRVTNPFTFDVPGAGFDDGVFDPVKFDDPDTVFIFDHVVNGRFNYGMFGT